MSKTQAELLQEACNQFPTLPPRGAKVAWWIEKYCTYTKGGGLGPPRPFVLQPFQLEIIAGIYPGLPFEKRLITRALISMARKNGKTELCSAFTLVHLCGPEAGRGTELVCAAAASQDQAFLVFQGSERMIKANPVLLRHVDFRHNRIIYKQNTVNNYIKTISTKPSSAQGLIPAFWTYDEIAEAVERDLFEALDYGQSDQYQGGLGIVISTRSTRPNSMFTQLDEEISLGQSQDPPVNKHWFRRVWSADPESKNPFTMDELEKANPGIDTIIDREMLQRDLDNAILSDSAKPGFRARRLNIESGKQDSLVDPALWMAAGQALVPRDELYETMQGEDAVLGVDLGSTTSMTAVAVWWPNQNHLSVVNFMAEDQVDHNTTLHKVPYREWANSGRLVLVGSAPDKGMKYDIIAEHIAKCFEMFNILSLRYDNWSKWRLWTELSNLGFDYEKQPMSKVLDKFIQGGMSYGEAITEFEDMIKAGIFKHDNDPVTNMSVRVCQVQSDPKATKAARSPAKNKQQLPNDAAVAMLMAISNRGLYVEKNKITGDDVSGFYDYIRKGDIPEDDEQYLL